MKPVNVGLLGLGTVGGGTVNVLRRNAHEITRRAGRGIRVSCAAARDRPRNCNVEGIRFGRDPYSVVDDPDVQIVVELIGGVELARELVLRAIANGRHVVTANKALIARHGNELFAAARERGVMVAFEAAVAGGIPIIKAIREGLAGNRIEWLAGIINGTCNYMLSAMREEGREFDEALAEAQRLGYAEADPAFDVDGIDAAHKLTILASIAFGIPLQFDRLHVEGIRYITRTDVVYAEELGYRIKHLGFARATAQGIELRVHPTLIPRRRLIANVDGVMNAVLVNGDAVGPTLYYGAGGGGETPFLTNNTPPPPPPLPSPPPPPPEPTASAVVADLVDVVRALTSDPENRVPHLAFQPDALADTPILPMEAVETADYLRLQALDRPGVLADVTRILGERGISIEAMVQKEPAEGQDDVSVILLTQRVREGQMNDAIQHIERLQSVTAPVTRIRVESLGR